MNNRQQAWQRAATYEDVRGLISSGVSTAGYVDPDYQYGTLYYAAFMAQSPAIIRYLVSEGADVNHRDLDGFTPLHILCDKNLGAGTEHRIDAIAALVAEGADVNLHCKFGGSTPLGRAVCRALRLEGIEILLDAGANIMAQDELGFTPFHAAVSHPDTKLEVIEALLARGADPTARTHAHTTPLHLVGESRDSVALATLLIEAGADPNAKRKDHKSPVDHIITSVRVPGEETVETVRYLIDCGARTHASTLQYLADNRLIRSDGGEYSRRFQRMGELAAQVLEAPGRRWFWQSR